MRPISGVTRLARWPARSRSSGDGAVSGNRRAHAGGGGSGGGGSCAVHRKPGRTGRLIGAQPNDGARDAGVAAHRLKTSTATVSRRLPDLRAKALQEATAPEELRYDLRNPIPPYVDQPVKPRHCFIVEDGSEPAQVHGKVRVPLEALLSHDGRHRIVQKELLIIFQDKQIVSRDPTVGREYHAYVNELPVPEHLVHPVGIETNDVLATELEAVGLLQGTKTIRTFVEFGTAREIE